jgi:hypothetical protein
MWFGWLAPEKGHFASFDMVVSRVGELLSPVWGLNVTAPNEFL